MEFNAREILDALAAAIYVTDATGRITYYNEAAAALWGHRPKLGESSVVRVLEAVLARWQPAPP